MLLLVLSKDEYIVHVAENTFLALENLTHSPLEVLRALEMPKGNLLKQ